MIRVFRTYLRNFSRYLKDGIKVKTLILSEFEDGSHINSDLFECINHNVVISQDLVTANLRKWSKTPNLNEFDSIIIVGSVMYQPDIFEILKNLTDAKLFLWSTEDPYELSFYKDNLNKIDRVFTNDPNLPILFSNFEKFEYFPFGVCLKCIHQVQKQKNSRILFCGTDFPERIALFSRLKFDEPELFSKIDFIGHGWDKITTDRAHLSPQVPRKAMNDIYSAYSLHLNIERFIDIKEEFLKIPNSGVNTRILEIGATGGSIISLNSGFQILNHLPTTAITVVNSYKNLVEAINLSIANPKMSLNKGMVLEREIKLNFDLEKRLNLLLGNISIKYMA